jgi:hypothetical protein
MENNIVFRPSWFKTLQRWEPNMVYDFIMALNNYNNNLPVEITNERIQDLWEQVEPLLDSDRQKYKRRVEINIDNGKKGGAPKGNKNASKTTENNPNQPNTTENNQKQAKQAIEKEKEKENEMEKEKENAATTLVSYQFSKQDDPDDLELFTYMFAEFNESDTEFDGLYEYWVKLPIREQEDSVKFASNYIKYCVEKNKKTNLYYYLADKKYNWDSIRKSYNKKM